MTHSSDGLTPWRSEPAHKFTAPNVEAAMAGLCVGSGSRPYCHWLGKQQALMSPIFGCGRSTVRGDDLLLAIKERTDFFGFMNDRVRVHDHFLYLNDSDAVSRSELRVEQIVHTSKACGCSRWPYRMRARTRSNDSLLTPDSKWRLVHSSDYQMLC